MSEARGEILKRVRHALRDVPRHEQPGDVAVERGYRTTGDMPREQLIEQFVERVREYKATVRSVTTGTLPEAIAEACAARGVRRLLVPRDVPDAWIPDQVTPLPDAGLTHEEIDASDGVLTGCALGIAQTGTIVLDGGPRQGRRVLTLLPDYHLCVVLAEQIVGLGQGRLGHLHLHPADRAGRRDLCDGFTPELLRRAQRSSLVHLIFPPTASPDAF